MFKINFESFRQDVKNLFHRFPICIFFATLLYIALLVEGNSPFNSAAAMLFYAFATLLAYVLHLFSEEFEKPLKNLKIAGLWVGSFIALTAFTVYLETTYSNESWPKSIHLINATITLFLIVATLMLPFFREKDDIKIWNFSFRLLINAGITIIVAGIAFLCAIVLYFGTVVLFDLHDNSKAIEIIAYTSLVYLAILVFLLRTPGGDKKHDTADTPNKFTTALCHYLLLPFMLLYFAVAYFYGAKILITFTLPQGTIVLMVSVLMVLLLSLFILLYTRMLKNPEGTDVKILRKSAAFSIPLLLLMSISIFVRVSEYGITPERLYAITLNIWFYVMAIILAFGKVKRTSIIPLSAVLIIIITTAQPLNFCEITRLSISHRISAVAEEYHFDTKAKQHPYEWLKSLPYETRTALESDMQYIRRHYSDKDLYGALYNDEAFHSDKLDFYPSYNDNKVSIYINFALSASPGTSPYIPFVPGYTHFKSLHSWNYDYTIKGDSDVVFITDKDTPESNTFNIDLRTLPSSNEEEPTKPLRFISSDRSALILITDLTYSNSSTDNNFYVEGYVLKK